MKSGRPRVCMIAYYMPPLYSGAGRQALVLAKQLSDRFDVFFLTARHDDSLAQEELDGIRIFRLRSLGHGKLFGVVFALRLAWRLWSWRNRYDLAHTHGYPPYYAAALVALRVAARPNLAKISMMGSDDPVTLFAGRLGFLRRHTYRWIDVKIAPSAEIHELCKQAPASYVGKVAWIPNGVDTKRFCPADRAERRKNRERLELDANQPVALYVGVVLARKGVHELLQAWAHVTRALEHARLLIVGPLEHLGHGTKERPPYVQDLQRLVQELGIASSVMFLGERNDVETYMRSADVFCFASSQEGMPSVLLEALASGLPIVSYESSGVAEILDDGEAGFRVPPGGVDALASATLQILQQPDRRLRMAAAARSSACERFSLEAIADRYASLYNDVLDKNIGKPS